MGPMVIFVALKTALPQEPSEMKIKTESKLFLLIQFLKIMPKIIFRDEILPKFKHLLTQWKKSQKSEYNDAIWWHLQWWYFSKRNIKAMSRSISWSLLLNFFCSTWRNILQDLLILIMRHMSEDHHAFVSPSKTSLQQDVSTLRALGMHLLDSELAEGNVHSIIICSSSIAYLRFKGNSVYLYSFHWKVSLTRMHWPVLSSYMS